MQVTRNDAGITITAIEPDEVEILEKAIAKIESHTDDLEAALVRDHELVARREAAVSPTVIDGVRDTKS